jgi:hypothetical protein
MDLQKFVEFVDQYPTWFKYVAVAAFALVLLGLLTLRQPKTSTQVSGGLASPLQASAGLATAPDIGSFATPRALTDFFKYRQTLEGRFLELEEFAKRLDGKAVAWEAFVAQVSDQRDRKEFPILMIVASDEGKQPGLAIVMLPESLRTRAYSFRKGDRVRFEGILSSASSSPSVDAKSVELVPVESGG